MPGLPEPCGEDFRASNALHPGLQLADEVERHPLAVVAAGLELKTLAEHQHRFGEIRLGACGGHPHRRI